MPIPIIFFACPNRIPRKLKQSVRTRKNHEIWTKNYLRTLAGPPLLQRLFSLSDDLSSFAHTHTNVEAPFQAPFSCQETASLETLWHQEVCLETSWNPFCIGHWTHQQSALAASLALAVPSRCSQTSIGNATNGSADLGKRISKIQQGEDKSGLVTHLGCQTSITRNPSWWHGNICLLIGRQVYQQVPGVEKPTWKC